MLLNVDIPRLVTSLDPVYLFATFGCVLYYYYYYYYLISMYDFDVCMIETLIGICIIGLIIL